MANNRMYLRCKNCGKGFFLGKCFGWQYGTNENYYKYGFINELNKFYSEHCGCDKEEDKRDIEYLEPKFKKEDRHYENQFEIAYETFYKDEDLESKGE